MRRLLLAIALVLAPNGGANSDTSAAQDTPKFKLLVFSKTTGFRHESIPQGIALITQLGADNHFGVDASEDSTVFNEGNLANYRAVVFLNTTGTILDDNQKAAFEKYIKNGGGYVGVHSASDTEYNWPWYGGLVGAYFKSHPKIQPATIKVEDQTNPSTAFLGPTWQRTDEWYNFRESPRGRVHVLASLDETTYTGGTMGADHPVVWCHNYEGGRSWYTEFGHTKESYADPQYQRHLLAGIQFAAGATKGSCK
jgi:type 1 glutamine amidotransferase